MPRFEQYSAYYDLLYADKDYGAEAAYVAATLRAADPGVRTILELGSGTGRHGRQLAALGFEVCGVELSAEMAAEAQRTPSPGPGAFACAVGDLRIWRAGRTFDAVISLFHVMSYQTRNADLQAAFEAAGDHLRPGGLFFFDVWHGPAVLAQRPERRTKVASDDRRRVRREALPALDAEASTVTVTYALDCEDLATGERFGFEEQHPMRYLFPTEIDHLADAARFQRLESEEFLTGRPPSDDTWGVAYLMAKSR
jgi:SAM-dependent methyltransferase